MKKTKALFILHYSPPIHGASKVGDTILESQTIKGAFDSKFIKIKSSQRIDEIGKFSAFKIFAMIELFFKVCLRLVGFRPKVIYYTISPHGFAFYRDVLVLIPVKFYRFLTNSELFYHYHARGIDKFVVSSKFKRTLTNFVISNTNIIFISELLRSEVQNLKGYKKIYFLQNGVENTLSSEEFDTIVHLRSQLDNTRVLYLSNMIREKGYDIVLDLALKFKSLNLNIKFDFAGGWASQEDEQYFKSFVEQHKLYDVVTYNGLVLGEDKKALFSKSTLFIFPSQYRREVFPLSILEALSYGLPVLSFNIGATSDIINEKIGILTNKASIFEDLNMMIEKFQSEMAYTNCRATFIEQYTLDAFERNLVKILKA